MSNYAEGTPTVSVTLGGTSYEIGYTWGVKRRIRDKLKEKGLADANQEEYLAVTIWAGLTEENRQKITVDQIEDWINPTNEQLIVQKLKDLIGLSEPEPDPNAKPGAVKTPTPGENQSSQSNRSGQLASTT